MKRYLMLALAIAVLIVACLLAALALHALSEMLASG